MVYLLIGASHKQNNIVDCGTIPCENLALWTHVTSYCDGPVERDKIVGFLEVKEFKSEKKQEKIKSN